MHPNTYSHTNTHTYIYMHYTVTYTHKPTDTQTYTLVQRFKSSTDTRMQKAIFSYMFFTESEPVLTVDTVSHIPLSLHHRPHYPLFIIIVILSSSSPPLSLCRRHGNILGHSFGLFIKNSTKFIFTNTKLKCFIWLKLITCVHNLTFNKMDFFFLISFANRQIWV